MNASSSNVPQALAERFFDLYPGEAAALLDDLPIDEVLRLFASVPVSLSVKVFLRLNPDVAARLIEKMNDDFFCRLYTDIDIVRGAIVLARLDENTIRSRLSLLPKNLSKEYYELMSYPPDSAGNLMDPQAMTFNPSNTIEQVLEKIRALGNRRIIDVCVVDEEGNLVGVVPLQTIAVSQPSQRLDELIYREPFTVNIMDPKDEIVKLLEEQKLASLPVVNLDGKLLGIIRHDALVSAAQQEASQDMQAMFGAGRDERALSRISFAIKKRLPWLEINLATAFLAAAVVGLFEDTIAKFTILAVFLPVVAGQAGNTGSQALAVTMRGLALREIRARHWLRVSSKEMAVGLLNGLAIAITTSVIVYLSMSSIGLSVVIGSAMVLSMVIAGLSGALIPIILQSFGQDPAQSSSIILTTVTDVVGFMSFLGLAALFAGTLQIA